MSPSFLVMNFLGKLEIPQRALFPICHREHGDGKLRRIRCLHAGNRCTWMIRFRLDLLPGIRVPCS